MKKTASVMLMFGLFWGATAHANEQQKRCDLMVRASVEKLLGQLSDFEVRKGLCQVSLTTSIAAADGDQKLLKICQAASLVMAREFRKRYPRADVHQVSGSC